MNQKTSLKKDLSIIGIFLAIFIIFGVVSMAYDYRSQTTQTQVENYAPSLLAKSVVDTSKIVLPPITEPLMKKLLISDLIHYYDVEDNDENETNETNDNICVDYDGEDYFTDSYVTVERFMNNNSYTTYYHDFCQTVNILSERVCDDQNEVETIVYDCEFGCYNDACLEINVTEPQIMTGYRARFYQHLDNPVYNHKYVTLWTDIYTRYLGLSANSYIQCNSLDYTKAYDASSYNNYDGDLVELDSELYYRTNLELINLDTEDFADISCYMFSEVGPYQYSESLDFQGVNYPEVTNLMFLYNPANGVYYIFYEANSEDVITGVNLDAEIFGDDNEYYTYMSFDHDSEHVSGMVPLDDFNIDEIGELDYAEMTLRAYVDEYNVATYADIEIDFNSRASSDSIEINGVTYDVFDATSVDLSMDDFKTKSKNMDEIFDVN